MFNESLKKLLNLSVHESAILNALKHGSQNISSLSGSTGFARTTLYTALATLEGRGLIQTEAWGRSVKVSLLSPAGIGTARAGSVVFADSASSPTEDSGFRIIKGKESMFQIWANISRMKNSRILCIQPTRSLVHTIKKFKPGEFIPLNEAVKKNKIIMEVVAREDIIPAYLSLHKGTPAIQKGILKSFLGRMADVVHVKNEFLDSDSEMIITPKSAYLLNWKSEIAVEIRNADMVGFLRELFDLAKGYGDKVDFNSYVAKFITEASRRP
ncbi:MAG TPA: helix-turn-helix domain-containing protein [Candidatus Paceibacterota bacterium]